MAGKPAIKFAKERNMYYVYILKCSDNFLYTGCTSDLKDRVARHELGQVTATKSRLPVVLYSYTAFYNKYKAYEFEKYLKTGSGRAFVHKHLL